MFNLTLKTGENGGSLIIYENSSFICEHRHTILELAVKQGANITHSSMIYFLTEEEMFEFASKISSLK